MESWKTDQPCYGSDIVARTNLLLAYACHILSLIFIRKIIYSCRDFHIDLIYVFAVNIGSFALVCCCLGKYIVTNLCLSDTPRYFLSLKCF